MANKALIGYINSQLKYGYTLMQIRQNLIANGYDEKIIDNAIDHLYHKDGLSRNTLIIMGFSVLGAIIIISSLFMVLSPVKSPQKLLDIEIKDIDSAVFAGDSLSFNIELINMGKAANYDVQMKYEILQASTSSVVKIKEEAVAIEKRSSKNVQIDIPYDVEKGQYMLRATAYYDDKAAKTTSSFSIDKKETCLNGIEDSYEEGIDCGGPCVKKCEQIIVEEPIPVVEEPLVSDDTVESEKESPDEVILTDEVKPVTTNIDEIANLSRTDLEKAGGSCDQKQGAERDYCFSAIAIETAKDNLCEFIADTDRKDSCYMNIAINTQSYGNCGKISNERLKESCELLA